MHFNETLFLNSLIIGIASGGLIALIALGYTLVYGIVEIINFAHGDVYMMGAFFAMTVVAATGVTGKSAGWEIIAVVVLALSGAMVFSALLNFGIDRIAYRRLRRAPRLAPLIAAIGISFILQNIAIYWKGSNQVTPPKLIPPSLRTYNVLNEWFNLGTTVRIRPLDIAVIFVPIPLLIGLTWFVYRTRAGKAMRAVAQDRSAAALMGIDVNRSIATAFLLGGAMAGAGGMVALYYNNSANYHMGFRYGLYAFTAAVLGGIGNLAGATLGGLLIGLIWAFSDGFMKEYVSGWGTQWTPAVIFGMLVIVMVFKPTGILGQSTVDKV